MQTDDHIPEAGAEMPGSRYTFTHSCTLPHGTAHYRIRNIAHGMWALSSTEITFTLSHF